MILIVDVIWIVFLITSKMRSNESKIRRQADKYEFWRRHHHEITDPTLDTIRNRFVRHMKQDHQLLRVFYQKYDVLADDPRSVLTGAQKSTIVAFVVIAEMTVTAAL